jgi:DNA modification methylase
MVNKIVHGDCLSVMSNMREESARLVIADPPYFNVLLNEVWDTQWKTEDDYLDWTEQWVAAALRLLMPGGLLYCFGQLGKREHAFIHAMSRMSKIAEYHDLIIWDRVVGYNDRHDSLTPAYEMLFVLRKKGEVYFDKDAVRVPYTEKVIQRYSKDKRYKDRHARMRHLEKGKYATNIWSIPSLKGVSKEKVGHPSQKPESLIERIVRSSSAPGDLVVDPFLGSGTTAVVAERLGRQWVGIEESLDYVTMAQDRLSTSMATPEITSTRITRRKPSERREHSGHFVGR